MAPRLYKVIFSSNATWTNLSYKTYTFVEKYILLHFQNLNYLRNKTIGLLFSNILLVCSPEFINWKVFLRIKKPGIEYMLPPMETLIDNQTSRNARLLAMQFSRFFLFFVDIQLLFFVIPYSYCQQGTFNQGLLLYLNFYFIFMTLNYILAISSKIY